VPAAPSALESAAASPVVAAEVAPNAEAAKSEAAEYGAAATAPDAGAPAAPSYAQSGAASGGPSDMPVAGAGDWLPGGNATLFSLLAGVLVALAAAGRLSAARRA